MTIQFITTHFFTKVIILSLTVVSLCNAEKYDYPYENPLTSTIVGTPRLYEADIPVSIPVNTQNITIFPNRKIPELFWYQKHLNFSCAKQPKPAPLIFILAGTGSGFESSTMNFLQKIFYQAGFHVINLPSVTHPNFIITASSHFRPGDFDTDSADLYRVMKKCRDTIANDVEITKTFLTGYSLGGAHAAMIAQLDNTQKVFDFEKVLIINPPVNLYAASLTLDNLLNDNIPGGKKNIGPYFNQIIDKFAGIYLSANFIDMNRDFLASFFQNQQPSDTEMSAMIGLSFRYYSSNMFFIADALTHSGVVIPQDISLSSNDSLTEYFKVFQRLGCTEYLHDILFPFYKSQDTTLTLKQFTQKSSLHHIKDFLQSSKHIALVTNTDDIILSPDDLKFLKATFKDRITLYPKGGHLGNITHIVNIKNIIHYFKD
jgi:hypothetical protein